MVRGRSVSLSFLNEFQEQNFPCLQTDKLSILAFNLFDNNIPFDISETSKVIQFLKKTIFENEVFKLKGVVDVLR
jgi:hypothetical protein